MKFSESLKKNNDFKYVYKNGKSQANKFLVMYVLENNEGKNRLGISASKKVGNSVIRHRFTRLVRESYRLHENIFNSGLD
ncbi:MAG: ribonuclease P protein component, partial [Ruminococcus sp.]|nr:ribonuclease P protein component [Ruminococcus sp.]